MSTLKRIACAMFAASLMTPAFSASPRKLDIRTRTVTLRHVSADNAIHLLHWDDINSLPKGIIDVSPVSDASRSLQIEGTPEGIASAVQAITFIDVAPRRVRISVQFALLRRPASVKPGRKLPSARTVIDSAFRRVPADTSTVSNNDEADIHMTVVHPGSGADDEESGIDLSPRVNDNGTVTLHGTVKLDAVLANLGLEAAGPDAMGMVELVRTVPNGKSVVVGGFRVRPASDSDATPFYLYILITPHAQ